VTRLYNVGVEPYLISASLTGVLAQRLVRRLCPACREQTSPSGGALQWLERRGHHLESVYQPAGCSQCRRKGYAGRTGIYEMFVPDDEIRDAITGKATLDQLRALAKKNGMRTLLEDGLAKAAQGMTTLDEILRVTIT
jgi:type II secretory ATPase GspE/PulE/Tfp pilus assembly ATPase PilB-like protein